MKSTNKSAARAMTAINLAFVSSLLVSFTGCSKSEDEKLKEDVAAIRAIKEKEQADQEAGKKRIRARLESGAAGVSAWGTESPASAASTPQKTGSKQ